MHQPFDALYREHHDAVLRYFLRTTKSLEDAEDLTGHVFEKAWRAYRGFEDRGNKGAHWLARISRNVLIDHWRRARPPRSALDEVLLVDERADCERHVYRSELRRQLVRALHALTPTQRDVVLYRWVHELSIIETGERLGMSSLAVRAAQQRAFATLRVTLTV